MLAYFPAFFVATRRTATFTVQTCRNMGCIYRRCRVERGSEKFSVPRSPTDVQVIEKMPLGAMQHNTSKMYKIGAFSSYRCSGHKFCHRHCSIALAPMQDVQNLMGACIFCLQMFRSCMSFTTAKMHCSIKHSQDVQNRCTLTPESLRMTVCLASNFLSTRSTFLSMRL